MTGSSREGVTFEQPNICDKGLIETLFIHFCYLIYSTLQFDYYVTTMHCFTLYMYYYFVLTLKLII